MITINARVIGISIGSSDTDGTCPKDSAINEEVSFLFLEYALSPYGESFLDVSCSIKFGILPTALVVRAAIVYGSLARLKASSLPDYGRFCKFSIVMRLLPSSLAVPCSPTPPVILPNVTFRMSLFDQFFIQLWSL